MLCFQQENLSPPLTEPPHSAHTYTQSSLSTGVCQLINSENKMLIAKQILNEWVMLFTASRISHPSPTLDILLLDLHIMASLNKQREALKYDLKLSLHHKWELNDFKNVFKHIFLYIYIYIYILVFIYLLLYCIVLYKYHEFPKCFLMLTSLTKCEKVEISHINDFYWQVRIDISVLCFSLSHDNKIASCALSMPHWPWFGRFMFLN